jgi:hypothetical protein
MVDRGSRPGSNPRWRKQGGRENALRFGFHAGDGRCYFNNGMLMLLFLLDKISCFSIEAT